MCVVGFIHPPSAKTWCGRRQSAGTHDASTCYSWEKHNDIAMFCSIASHVTQGSQQPAKVGEDAHGCGAKRGAVVHSRLPCRPVWMQTKKAAWDLRTWMFEIEPASRDLRS